MLKVLKTTTEDINDILKIFTNAQKFMQQTGNPTQWTNGYPSREILEEDIKKNISYKIVDDNNVIQATFTFFIGEDPTYAIIEEGKWLDDSTYGVIHRLASTGIIKRITDVCINFCFNECNHLRVDTHEDNKIMQNAFLRNGFIYTGIIYVRDNSKRMAFEKI